jgi:outer membrane protein OmpA-like peptidoglycan-associated protein
MKRIFFLLIAANGALSAIAQAPSTTDSSKHHHKWYKADNMLMRWVVDVNALAGVQTQDYTPANNSVNFANGIAGNNLGKMKFTNGMSYGADAQLGYFFGKKAHFGIGTGIMYLYQTGDVTLDAFHVQYQSTDNNGNAFRQVITANDKIKEQLTTTNINIPLLLKYKKRFSQRFGFTADAGVLFNLQMKTDYKTNANFDYEAIYQFTGADASTGLPTVYDNGVNPNSNDFLMTKAHYLSAHPGGNVGDYMAGQRAQGYNVGLGMTPDVKEGSVSYVEGSVGFLFRPALNIFLSDWCALNVGAYYLYQPFNNNVPSGYKLTDKVGGYSSMLNGVSSGNTQSYGGNLGVRFFFGRPKDSDGDGIPDRKDKCPHTFGVAQFNGCPDSDGDGIQDTEDSCVDVPGPMQFHGCPDTDGDGIQDKDDSCPFQAGPLQFHGCPDTDGDGIPDNYDRCPKVPGPASNQGCPYDTVKPAPPPPPEPGIDPSTPILFDFAKTQIHESSLDILEEAVLELNDNKSSYIIIDGHTDDIGSPEANKILSYKRAQAVKEYLKEMGIDEKRLITVGHGEEQPVAPNTSSEGRAKNRRVIMTLRKDH